MEARRRSFAAVVLAAVLASGCADEQLAPPPVVVGDARIYLPRSYTAAQSYPLLLVLHGWIPDDDAVIRRAVESMHFQRLVDEKGFIVAAPRGTSGGSSVFWNATPACCAPASQSSLDHVGRLSRLIDELARSYSIDAARVYVAGHSNGGFMALRMACDRSDKVAAALSLAGAAYKDASRCRPSRPVSVLLVHGDQDSVVSYRGGDGIRKESWHPYPSAAASASQWAQHDGCAGALQTDPQRLDLDGQVAGTETLAARHGECPAGVDVELWTLQGADHWPDFSSLAFARRAWTWLARRSRAAP